MTKTKTKTTLVVLSTLVLGIVLGFLLHANIMRMKFEQFGELRKPGGFFKRIENILDLTEEQKHKIEPLIEKHQNNLENFRFKMEDQLDSLRNSVKKHLTKEQIIKLEKYFMHKRGFPPPHGFRPKPEHLRDRNNL